VKKNWKEKTNKTNWRTRVKRRNLCAMHAKPLWNGTSISKNVSNSSILHRISTR